ncbi:MAG: NADH-quinone oxidoreductase subunit NuoG [Anaerolineae bacterium]
MSTERLVHLTIDGQEVGCPEGSTVYEAATAAGIHIPTFCHHEKLVPVGACRMCLVEIEGLVALQTSCTTPVREGMVVKVHTSETAVEARRANIEFLLTNHPLDCPVCDKGGECPLQNQAMADGPGRSRYIEPKRHKLKRFPLGEFIVLDQERCVLCWRCIRYLDEWADDHELDLFGRGADTRLQTFDNRPLRSKWQGNTIDICPVGALTSRDFRFEARPWELANVPSICSLCPVGCNLILGMRTNELRRITPRGNPNVNDVWICDKGRYGHAFVDDGERLTMPLIRREGQLQPATWDEALETVAQRLAGAVAEQGPEAVAGLGSTRATNEANYLFQRLMRTVAHTNNVDHPDRIPEGAAALPPLPTLEDRDAVLLLGCDPSTEAPLVELWLKKAVLRHGARIVIANPWQIELGRYGGPWLGYRPGGGLALLNGLVRALLEAGEGERGLAARVTNLEEARERFRSYTPATVERAAGTSSAALAQAAQVLAGARRPLVIYGQAWLWEAAQLENPAAALEAIANLSAILGAEAGLLPRGANARGALEAGLAPGLYPGRQPMDDNRVRSRLASFWGSALSPVAGLDWPGMLAAAREGRLAALWVMANDPVHDWPAAAEALKQIPFLVVQDLFLTPTAALADVVLPATSPAGGDGTLINLSGRVQALRPGKRPPGSARPDWRIVADLARRMVEPKQRRNWEFDTAADVLAEMSRVIPGWRELDQALLSRQGWPTPRASTPNRRAVAPGPQPAPARDPKYPLVLCPGRLLYDRSRWLQASGPIQAVVPEAYVTIHPADAQRLGLADGDEVSIVSPAGEVPARLQVAAEVVPGVALAPLDLGDVPLGRLYEAWGTLPWVRIVARLAVAGPAGGA